MRKTKMRLCWDTLEGVYLTRNGNFCKTINHNKRLFIYKENCKFCGNPFLADYTNKKATFCDNKCANSGVFSPSYGGLSEEHKNKISVAISAENHPMYNKKHTEMSLNKMRKSTSNRVGCNNPFYGRKHTMETKSKISRKNKGNNYGQVGPKHSQWKGGISYEPYCPVWTDKEYKESIKERDNYVCQNPFCENGAPLRVHHINYNKKDCQPQNLITLCNSCNLKANTDRDWHTSLYTELIRRKYEY